MHKGKPYIVVGNAAGQLRCVDPADGKVLWQKEKVGRNDMTMSVRGPYLLCNGNMAEKGDGRLACYRIDLEGAEHLWTIDNSKIDYRPMAAPPAMTDGHAFIRDRRPEGLTVVDLAGGKIAAKLAYNLSASGYVQIADGKALLQIDASHGPTDLLWYDIAAPGKAAGLGDHWPTRHRTTASYYPILISHAIADGRIFIRGARGIYCYDLRRQ